MSARTSVRCTRCMHLQSGAATRCRGGQARESLRETRVRTIVDNGLRNTLHCTVVSPGLFRHFVDRTVCPYMPDIYCPVRTTAKVSNGTPNSAEKTFRTSASKSIGERLLKSR